MLMMVETIVDVGLLWIELCSVIGGASSRRWIEVSWVSLAILVRFSDGGDRRWQEEAGYKLKFEFGKSLDMEIIEVLVAVIGHGW